MAPPANTPDQAADKILGYRVVEQLYVGSRTTVYRAVQASTQQPVVIKVLRQEHPSFSELVQFRNQYTIAKNLPIPGIAQPLSLEPFGSGYALVMEDGGETSLAKYLQQQSLDLAEVLAIALQIAEILHALGQHRVVHKDIKPANILIHPESKQVKLIDFSIASLLPKETQEIQNPNILEGTLAYLAPEQTGRMNRGIDYRADFYALGVTLYQLLTGTLPFTSEDPLELVHCHIAKRPVPVDQANPAVPTVMTEIVAKLIAKNAEDRYQSALGIKHDLAQCLQQWQTTGGIADFELGQRDVSDRFLIPEKLYGRDTEVKTLLDAFERVTEGTCELMLVAGFSGIGKTAVVNEVHKPIARQRGYFIKGKFDQFNFNIPFSALVQALRDLMEQLLLESDSQLQVWRTRILATLDESSQVIIEVIPELERIIGSQPPAPKLKGMAAQNRFNLLFQKFIQVFTTPEHPLVMFLDDLQWADSASLRLIRLLISETEIDYFLLIGAYRNNEVFPAHPLMLTLAMVNKAGARVNEITLHPLSQDSLNQFVAETLHCSTGLAQPLSDIVMQKTQGNPFFATQFLKALHQEKLITFDTHTRHWQCDMVQVREAALTDDILEFMVLQLKKLTNTTQTALKLAACIGNQFDLDTLATVSEQSPTEVATALWAALQAGLILPQSDIYKFHLDDTFNSFQNIHHQTPHYKFLHDRVQQAAYSLIPEDKKKVTHLNIGRRLLKNRSQIARNKNLFNIVNQLNIGKSLITKNVKLIELAKLNLDAGQKSKVSTAYAIAFNYFSTGISLLPNTAWKNQYRLSLSLHESATEAAYLSGKFEQVDYFFDIVSKQSQTPLDQVKVVDITIQKHGAEGEANKAVEAALVFLKELGLEFPQEPTQNDVGEALEKTKKLLSNQSIKSLIDLPAMQEKKPLSILVILSSVMTLAYQSNPNLFLLMPLKQIELSHQYGNSSLSSFAYVVYGFILCAITQDIDAGYQFGKLGITLLEKYYEKEVAAKVLTTFNAHVRTWKEHIKESLSPLLETYAIGLESGDLEFAAFSLHDYNYHLHFSGENLLVSEQQQQSSSLAFKKINQDRFYVYNSILLQYTSNLLWQPSNPCQLIGDFYNEKAMMPVHLDGQDAISLLSIAVFKLQLYCLFGNLPHLHNYLSMSEDYSYAGLGQVIYRQNHFYSSLARLAAYHTVSSVEQADFLEKVVEKQTQMKIWAEHAPMNALHQYQLVEAERYRVLGAKAEAIEHYDVAIAGAKANKYTQEEALANELAAKFYLDWGKEKIAQDYLINAYYAYTRWGANTKIQDLERRYSDLLLPILRQAAPGLSAKETVFSTGSITTLYSSRAETVGSSSTHIAATLDLATVLKVSQTLSSEIQLDKLLATLLHTMLENAGADKGALLMPREQRWFVEAVATVEQPAQVQSIALSSSTTVPRRLINTVQHNLEPTIIIDATLHPMLAADPYVLQQQPKSLLCTPILNQGKLVAILYLENQVTVGAFTGDRVKLLNVLCTQAAISLENARLYQKAQAYAQQLEQSQLQIVQSEKMASLGNLVAGVAHEINNPIGFLNGSIRNGTDYVQDLQKHLDLYQQYYPEPVQPIQDHAEEIDLDFLSADLPKLLSSMKGATDRIKSISTSLRTFSRADIDHKVSANLHDGIESTLLILKYRLKANEHRPAITVIKDYGEISSINCFPGQLNQVFMNILANAIDMFDEMAQTRSLAELKANPQQITIRTAMRQNQMQISIGDNGRGMSKEVKDKIFDHLFTTKGVGKGTGLGLAISRQIVEEKHDGSLAVKSEFGQGTEFCISLPLAAG